MYEEYLSENAAKLLELINYVHPNLEKLRQALATGIFTPAEMNAAYIAYLDEHQWEYSDFILTEKHIPTEEDLQSFSLRNAMDILRLFSEFGIDYCAQLNQSTILDGLKFVDYPFLAAEIARFIFEHDGIRSALLINDSYENFMESVDSEICFELTEVENPVNADNLFSLYMIAVGYGCHFRNGKTAAAPIGNFDLAKLRNYKDYSWESYIENGRTYYRIYEKATHQVVALY